MARAGAARRGRVVQWAKQTVEAWTVADEVELKFRLDGPGDHERLRGELAALGGRPGPVQHEENLLFDMPQTMLRERQQILRLRVLDGGPKAKLTFKGPARFSGSVKSRAEIEVDVSDAAVMQQLLEALGYGVTLSYSKEREAWRLGQVEVALDTLAFGHFVEVEGPAEEITALARRLRLDESRAEAEGYPALMARHMRGGG